MGKYSDILTKVLRERESTSGADRAGSAAASGGQASRDSFQKRLQNETRGLYSQQTQMQGSLYAQIAQQMRTTPQPAAPTAPLTQGSLFNFEKNVETY